MKIIISPYSQKMRNGNKNPKDFSCWDRVIQILKADGHNVTQIGVTGEARFEGVDEFLVDTPMLELKGILMCCDVWISVDNFLPHMAALYGKPGIVIFGKSDPEIFGYPLHKNLLKDHKYLREFPYDIWEKIEFSEDCFVEPEVVCDAVKEFVNA